MKRSKLPALFLIFLGTASLLLPADTNVAPLPQPARKSEADGAKLAVRDAFNRLPLGFESNRGQADSEIKFLSRGRGYDFFLTSTGAVLTLRRSVDSSGGQGEKIAVLRMKFEGSNTVPRVTGVENLPGKVNYYVGNDPSKWRADIPTYARVKYEDLYPGIDLEYYGDQRQLEYDLVLAPGADPSTIVLSLKGADEILLDAAGNIVVRVSGGEILHRAPILYQNVGGVRREVSGHFTLRQPNLIGFEVGAYDSTKPLVIDPLVLSYSTFLGGSGADAGYGIAVGSDGSAYVVGKTQSANFPTVNPTQTFGGTHPNPCYIDYQYGPYCPDAFVTRFSADGSALTYSTYIGGNLPDEGLAIAVDGSGNAYATGWTDATDLPTLNPLQASTGGGEDAFVVKLSPTGTLVYSTYLGGSGDERGYGIDVDSAGHAYVTGSTRSNNFPTTVGALEATSSGRYCHIYTPGYSHCYEAFVSKLNADGSALDYSTFLGAADHGDDKGFAVNVDADGVAYVTGQTDATDFPVTSSVLQGTIGGGVCETNALGGTIPCPDAFVVKLSAAGDALTYSTFLGGTVTDIGRGVAVDASGNAYVTGYTISTNFPTASPIQAANAGGYDAFVAKLNTDATSLTYSTYLGGSGTDYAYGIKVNSAGQAYVAGVTASTDFPTHDPLQAANAGNGDAFVTKLDAAGSSQVYSTYLGGSGADYGYAIALDSSSNAYVCGSTGSTDFYSVAAYQPARSGTSTDAYLTKIVEAAENPAPVLTSLSPADTTAGGSAFTLTLRGSGFVSDSAAQWNRSARTTTFVNVTRLTAEISASDVAIPGAMEVTVVNPEPGGGTSDPLTFEVNGPIASLSTASLAFGNQRVGTPSDVQTVTLTNTGNVVLNLTSIAAGGDFTENNNCGASLAAAANCTINVTFTPTTTGLRTATLSITDDAAGSPQTVDLSGTGAVPAVSLSPTSLSFGNQALGTTSTAKPVKLTNSGLAPLTITSITTSGNYAQTNDCPNPLAAAAYCTVNVTFSPAVAGGQSGTLTIGDDAAGSPHTAGLGGVGPVATLSTPGLSFGNQAVGTTSAPKPVNLSNTGNASLTITSIVASGNFAQTNNCVSPLAARSYCTLSVTFTPTAAGTRTGAITIVDNATGSPHSVSLSGNGTVPAVTLSPTGLSFGNQALGTTSTAKPVKLTNSGLAPLTIASIGTSGNYAQTNNCVSPLAAKAYCTIQVTFMPTVVGGQSGTLTIGDDAAGSPHTAGLGGVGVGPVVILSTASLNFGNQPLGTTSAPRLVNLSNTGNASLTITSIVASGDFAQTNNCVSPLAARSYCTLSVTFTPTAAGTRTGAITIVDNATGSPHSVNLTGTGVSP